MSALDAFYVYIDVAVQEMYMLSSVDRNRVLCTIFGKSQHKLKIEQSFVRL